MPAKNPRLTITIEPQLAEQLRRLSELTGNSQSALISELLEGSSVVFSRLIKVLEAAREAREAFRGALADDLEEAQGKIEHRLGLTLQMADEQLQKIEGRERAERFERELVERAGIQRRAGRGAGSPPAPRRQKVTPVSNRGVRSTKQTGKTVSGAKGRVRQNQG